MTPHLVVILGTAEDAAALRRAAVLPALAAASRVSFLSAIDNGGLPQPLAAQADWVLPLVSYPERRLLRSLRRVIDASPAGILPVLAGLERHVAMRLRPHWDREEMIELLDFLQPSLILNCAPVAFPPAELPLRMARRCGVPTAACIRERGDLNSRARLAALYDLYAVPDRPTRRHVLRLLPGLSSSRVLGGEAPTPSVPAAAYQAFAAWWQNGRKERPGTA